MRKLWSVCLCCSVSLVLCYCECRCRIPAQIHGLLITMDLAELRVFVGAEFVPSTRILHHRFVVGVDSLKDRGLFQPEWFCSVWLVLIGLFLIVLWQSIGLEKSGCFSLSFFRWNGTVSVFCQEATEHPEPHYCGSLSHYPLFLSADLADAQEFCLLVPTSHMTMWYFTVSPDLWCGRGQGFSASCVWSSCVWCWGGSCDGIAYCWNRVISFLRAKLGKLLCHICSPLPSWRN